AFRDNGDTVTVTRGAKEYLLIKGTWECDCELVQTMKLPCRHAMVYRKAIASPFITPFAAINPRMQWLWNMQAVCRNAVLCCTWLSRDVKPKVEDPARPSYAVASIGDMAKYRY
ncbi:hypothetical protein JG688_00018630, partial [Phytophthora aleatoria]